MSYKQKLSSITTFIFDVDGVLTDGNVLVTAEGELLRSVSVKDGYAIKTALQKGYRVCLITGGTHKGVEKRFAALGIQDIYMNAHLKNEPMQEIMDKYHLKSENILYMGDDIPDILAMNLAGLATCPQNAVPEVKEVVDYVSYLKGGEGCAREVIEQVLKVRGDWASLYSAKND